MRLRPTEFLLSVVLIAGPFANELNAQTTTSGGLTGVVTDQSNAVVLGANVEIRDNSKGTTQITPALVAISPVFPLLFSCFRYTPARTRTAGTRSRRAYKTRGR